MKTEGIRNSFIYGKGSIKKYVVDIFPWHEWSNYAGRWSENPITENPLGKMDLLVLPESQLIVSNRSLGLRKSIPEDRLTYMA